MDIKKSRDGVILKGGKLSLTQSRSEALAQRLTIRLRTVFGSWFLNTNYGVDYFNRVFEKTIPKSSIDTMFQAEINKDVRVAKIISFSSVIKDNTYQLNFKVKAKDGLVSDVVELTAGRSGIQVNF